MAADRRRRRFRAFDAAAERSASSVSAIKTSARKNPRLVYAALHGYRDGGPYSGQPAYDDVIQGQSGIAALMSEVAGEPRYAPMIIADKTCALAIAGAVSAALFARERTGRGQFVEIPMFEQMVSFVLGEHLFGHNFVPPLGRSAIRACWPPGAVRTRPRTAISA